MPAANLLGGATPYERRTQPEYTTDESSVRSGAPMPPLATSAIPEYLKSCGYCANDSATWKEPFCSEDQSLQITVTNSTFMAGHTWYFVRYTITIGDAVRKQWRVPRRLCHFREGLYDHVVREMPRAVKERYFQSAPFALRGGPPGTGNRLRGWCEALSKFINAGQASPSTLAQCLRWGERESSKTWTLAGMSREYTNATNREDTCGMRESTWGNREGRWAGREFSAVSREQSAESGGSNHSGEHVPAMREGTLTSTALGEMEQTSGGVSLRFGTPLHPISHSAVSKYLQKFGYQTTDPDSWSEPFTESNCPNFTLSTKGNYDMLGYTWYFVHVSLSTPDGDWGPGRETSWTVPRRLCHFQDGLLEHVNALPGTVYKQHFKSTSFTHIGLSASVEKLNRWCSALSGAMNSGQVSPFFVASCLRWAEHPTVAVWSRRVTHHSSDTDQDVDSTSTESTEAPFL